MLAAAARPAHRVDMMRADLEAQARAPVDGIVRVEETYELCLVNAEPFGRRHCYMVARADAGPACSVLRDSVDGVVGDRCTPPEDCEKVIRTLEAEFPGRTRDDLEFMPVVDVAPSPFQILVLVPDRDSTFASPSWQKATLDYAAASPDLRALAQDFAARCK